MDLVDCYTNGDKVVILFGQVKVLMNTKNPCSFQIKLQEKVKYSLLQTRRDIQGFLLINPDLTIADLNRMKFKTLSFLPTTENKHGICTNCSRYIIFREDINYDLSGCDSLANQLQEDIKQQFNNSTKAISGQYSTSDHSKSGPFPSNICQTGGARVPLSHEDL